MANKCISCDTALAYVANGSKFIDAYIGSYHSSVMLVFAAGAALWAVWQGYQSVIGSLDVHTCCVQFIHLIFASTLIIALNTGLAVTIYDLTITLLFGIPAVLMGSGGGSNEAVTALVTGVETAVWSPIKMAIGIMNGASYLMMVVYAVFSLLLIIPFVLMLITFITQLGVGMFRVTFICIISPFIVAFGAFPSGRQVIVSGIRTLISSIFVMVAVSIVFRMVSDSVTSLLPDGTGMSLTLDNDASVGNFILVAVVAWAGVAIIQEASSLANTIAQSAVNLATTGTIAKSMGSQANATISGGVAAGKGAAAVYRSVRDGYVAKGKDKN